MGKKLTVYLIDGTDFGPRTIEIGNWSGKGIYSPRAALKDMMHRPEFEKPGIYILKSDPNENIFSERIYIGEAERIGKRLKQHLQNSDKDFNECIFFVSKDEMLTKSHIKYIESRLVTLAKNAKNSEIENNNQPTESTLSEADISDMEEFLKQIKMILPIAGFNFLAGKPELSTVQSESTENEKIFYLKNRNYNAKMVVENDGFKVLKGSQANIDISSSISSSWIKLRKKLVHNKILISDGKNYIFTDDYFFTSPSAASSVILGRQSAGPIEWIDENKRTYKDYETENMAD